MKASTNKRRRDTTYTSKMIVETAIVKYCRRGLFETLRKMAKKVTNRGIRKAIPVRTTEETRHSNASSLEGKMKNHPAQCIPPNITPVTNIKRRDNPNSSSPPGTKE